MHQINVILDYITLFLTREPFEFDSKKSLCIQLLNNLISLEKYHKSIIVVQKWMFDIGLAEKYLRTNESNNIIIFCNESFQKPMSFMELEFREKKAVMESKNKLLNVLKDINLNQRLLQEKSKVETERSQLKLNSIYDLLDSVLEVHNQIQSQNKINEIKVDEIFSNMKSIEDKLENRVTHFELYVKNLNENINDISKKFSESEKELIFIQEHSKDTILDDINFTNIHDELNKIINSSTQMEEFIPLKTLSQDENLLDSNLTDFHKNYKLGSKIIFLNMKKNSNTITSVNTLLKNLNVAEQTFESNLKSIRMNINNVLNEQHVSTLTLNKLNNQLDELKKKKKSLVVLNRNNDNLKSKCVEDISNLDSEIHKYKIKLTVVKENNQQLYGNILSLNSIFHKTSQNNINELNIAHQELLLDDKLPNKVTLLYKKLNTAMNDHSELLEKRKEIMMDQFKRKKSDLDEIVKEYSNKFIGTCNVIKLYMDKMSIYKQFVKQLKDLAITKEMIKKDLLLIHRGQTLEQLNYEEMEFKSYINLYNKEIDEINKEDNNIEKYSKLTKLNMNAQIRNLKEKLQLITNANISLEMELNKNTNVRVDTD